MSILKKLKHLEADKRTLSVALVLAVSLAGGHQLQAGSIDPFQFTFTGITIKSTLVDGTTQRWNGTSHTGKLFFSSDADSSAWTRPGATGISQYLSAATLSGFVSLTNGELTGGAFAVASSPLASADKYTFSMDVDGNDRSQGNGVVLGAVARSGRTTYSLRADLKDAKFSGPMFGGVDASRWYDGQGLAGLFGDLWTIRYSAREGSTGNSSIDTNASLDFAAYAAPVPLPLPVAAGAVGMLAIFVRRAVKRRRGSVDPLAS